MENSIAKGVQSTQANQRDSGEEKSPALHFFLYLMSFLSLSFAASGVISILYAFIEKFVPDVSSLSSLSYYNYMDSFIVKYGISSIFIAGTVYIIVMWYINKLIFKGSVPESSKVRKWLTYIVLFIAAASVLGDLASLLYNFLDGDMALKFFLKFLVIIVVAGATFGFYLWDMRKRNMVGKVYKQNRIFGAILIVVFLVLVVAPFFFIASPFEARRQKIDQSMVDKLSIISNNINDYYQDRKTLPGTLSAVVEYTDSSDYKGYSSVNEKDIEKISYVTKGSASYQLCADFLTVSQKEVYSYNKEWQHGKGKKCFTKNVTDYEY